MTYGHSDSQFAWAQITHRSHARGRFAVLNAARLIRHRDGYTDLHTLRWAFDICHYDAAFSHSR